MGEQYKVIAEDYGICSQRVIQIAKGAVKRIGKLSF